MDQLLDIGGVSLRVAVDQGPAGAPWITFSNSHASDLGLWERQAHLLKDRFCILRYDTRGHGCSDAPVGPYGFEQLADDVIALWDRLGIARSALVGLSLGGTTALEVAARHRERVMGVLASDCRDHATVAFAQSWEPRISLARTDGMDALVPSTIERWFTPAYRSASPGEIERISAMIRRTSVTGYIGCAEALQGIDVAGRLGAIACPVRVVTGRHDPSAPPELAAAIAAKIAGATFAVIEDAAHITNIEQPEAFDRELEAFVAQL